jgi:DNA polymerase III delta subunit
MAKRSPTAPINPAQWTRATLPRVVLVAGPEAALRDEGIAAVKKAAFGESVSDGWVVLHGALTSNESDALTPAAVLDEVCTRSMFAAPDELKVVLVRGADMLLEKHFRVFEDNLDAIPDGAVLVLEAASYGRLKTTNLYKKVAARGAVIECDALAGEFNTSALEAEVEKRARAHGLVLTHGALLALLARSSKSVSVIEEELSKLALVLGPPSGADAPAPAPVQVSEHDIAEICATTHTATPFHFVDALLDGDARTALETLGTLFDRGIADTKKPGKLITQEDAIVIIVLGALTFKLSQVQDVRVALDAGKPEHMAFTDAKVFGFRQDAMRRTVRKHTGASLRRAVDALFHTYLDLRRGGGVDPRATMERLVFRTLERN